MDNVTTKIQTKLNQALENLKQEFLTIRTGRAHPQLLEGILVAVYGSEMRLIDLATISALEHNLLMVQPFDVNNVPVIEKAIRDANLGLNPSSQGTIIRVPLPPLSEETRRGYLKLIHDKAETGRISVRNIRHEAMAEIEQSASKKQISEDEKFTFKDQVQKEVDKITASLEELVKNKEKELLSI